MNELAPATAQGYLRFLGWAAASLALAVLIGFLPTRSLGGEPALAAMLAACSVTLVASAIGGIPLARARDAGGSALRPLLASMILRLAAVLVVTLGVLLGGALDRGAFLVWIAISYLALLPADTRYAVQSSAAGR